MKLKAMSFFVLTTLLISCSFAFSCPPFDPSTLWLPKNKKFAEKEFAQKAKKLNDSGKCVLEGSFGNSYQKFYITVSKTGNLRDAKILRFSFEELKK